MKITHNLYFKLISAFCISLVLRISHGQATEISPIIGVGQESFNFEISEFDPSNKSSIIKFEPNIAGVTRLGVNAYGFGIGYSFRGTEKSKDIRKGNTNFSDLQLGYHNKTWGVEGFYQIYTGFYTSNTVDIQSFPNLTFKHYALTGRYSLQDSDFSVGAIVDQADDIKGDAGKLYLVGGIREHLMETDDSLLKQENAGLNTELENLRKLKALSLNLGLGYGHYWRYSNNFFTGLLIDLLTTYANYDFESTTGKRSDSDYTLSYNFKLAGGYIESHYRFGLSLNGDVTTLKTTGRGFLKPTASRVIIYLRYVF
ncbi:DUF4421 domain-containing protein [bacterium]|nr:DUF4421 domain-containing protein [bacterium]